MTSFVGTPAYMSPEQHRGDRYDEKVDVYAYSLVCFELVTQRRPFEEYNSPMQMAKAVVAGERPTLSSQEMDDPETEVLRSLMMACWNDEPAERPSFEEIVKELEGLSNTVA